MIEALKGEEIVDKFDGRFKLCALIQHRLRELLDGARPLVERDGRSDLEVVIEEIMQGQIRLAEDPALTDEQPQALGAENGTRAVL